MTPTDVERKLAERYGRAGSSVRRRLAWIVGIGIAAVATVLLSWSTVTGAMSTVDAETNGYEVVDDHTVAVRAQISIAAGTAVACAFEAQDTEHGVVGWKIVEYAASEERSRMVVETVPTVSEATTGLVRSCWIP
ncbi:DUF4307 domain-containing protein [Microbacterium sp.]|uniref:DUF4307 domain-containing protein n=1 Tax=Microbacterium sp. TaxID=51671 RepID=UPI003736FC6B